MKDGPTIYDLCSATQISLRRDRSLPGSGRLRGGAAILSGCLRVGLNRPKFRWIGEEGGLHSYRVENLGGTLRIDLTLSTVEVTQSDEPDARRIEED